MNLGPEQLPPRLGDEYQLQPMKEPPMAKPNAKAPLGQGGRFAALKKTLAGKKGVHDPGALAAAIGRAKLGKAKFQEMAADGRKGA